MRAPPTGASRSARRRAGVAIAAADISTGRFELIECDAAGLDAELARLAPGRDDRVGGAARSRRSRRAAPRAEFDSGAASRG